MPPTVGRRMETSPENQSEDDFEIELEYDCSALTLDQSFKQVFSIMNSVKLPSIEKQQLNSL